MLLHFFEFLLHLLSSITSTIVILKILLYDRLGLITKLCICLIYSSAYVTDSAYSIEVYLKMTHNQIFLPVDKVFSMEPNPYRQASYIHEIGTWLYVWGVILTATERLLNGHFDIELKFTWRTIFASPIIVAIIGLSSYYCTALLLSAEYQQIAGVAVVASQIFGVSAIFYTIYLNHRRYKKGIGETLENRYRSSYVYKFNRSLLKSLLGEVFTRLLAGSCVFAVSFGAHSDYAFGWLSFIYCNLIPLGNIAFPWFIVLRHMKVDFCWNKKTRSAVQDLNGKDLAMTETPDEHFETLSRIWNTKP